MSEHKWDCSKIIRDLPVIQTLFTSEQEAIEYCGRFKKTGKIWTLYDVARFSYFLHKMDGVYKKADEHLRILMDINRLIMLASIVECLNSKEDFVRFDEWVKQKSKNNEFRKQGINVWHDYNRIHGSAVKFRTFFQDYLTKDEKIRLIKSVQFYQKEKREFLPLFCFKGVKCNLNHSYCNFDTNKTKCPVYASERQVRRGVKECANFLYTLRSRFVHEAKLFSFPKPLPEGVGGSSWLVDYTEYKFTTRNYLHQGPIMLGLFSNQLTELVKQYLKRMMQKYVETREETQKSKSDKSEFLNKQM